MSNTRKRIALTREVKVETEIFMGSLGISDYMLAEANQLLSIWGMTFLQYNALRILYDTDRDDLGLSSKEVGGRLYTRVPDMTRLLDRLADKGWVVRERDSNNRRVVRSRLTKIGEELVESVNLPMQELENTQLSSLTKKEKEDLVHLLNKALGKSRL
jgi:DNA-binding MarR family transcriptional regulator